MESTPQTFPEIEPYRSGYLQVSALHSIYYEEAGNPQGKPVIYLHGGPGGGLTPNARRFFDPSFYRILLFDQRGAGKSLPFGELRENTTWDLVADIERLRELFGVDRWLVFGGSWGSSLALAYAIRHPQRVTGLILRGIFLCRPLEIDWLYRHGASMIFPEGWDGFLEPIPVEERGDLLAAYHRRLTSDDEDLRLAAARAWCRWETYASRHDPDLEAIQKIEPPQEVLALARIENHYFMHNSFLETGDYLLEQASTLRSIPTRIVQGRYDMVCPIRSAWDLKRVLPEADLRIVPDGGHSIKDLGIRTALVQATEDFKALF